MGKPCIVGVGQIVGAFKDVEVLSIDGPTGRIWTEKVPTVGGKTNGVITSLTRWYMTRWMWFRSSSMCRRSRLTEALLYLGDQVSESGSGGGEDRVETLQLVDRLYLDLVPSAEEERYLNILSAHNHSQRLLDWLAKALPENLARSWFLSGSQNISPSLTGLNLERTCGPSFSVSKKL